MDSPESRAGMATPWRRHKERSSASCAPDQPPAMHSGQRPCRQSGQSKSWGPLACARYCARHSRCMRCRLQAGKGTARLAPWAAGERRATWREVGWAGWVRGGFRYENKGNTCFAQRQDTDASSVGAACGKAPSLKSTLHSA